MLLVLRGAVLEDEAFAFSRGAGRSQVHHITQQQSLIPLWLQEDSACLYSDWSICGT